MQPMNSSESESTQPYWSVDRVRDTFIRYFVEKRGHTYVSPSSVIPPEEDNSILFTNSGMVQFKPYFLGEKSPEKDFSNSRICNSQRCIRVGGKHNDLDDVGQDGYHHTLFEMLGNWSFNGDYFKEEAISWGWELLTEVYGLDKDRLYVTYFGGSKEDNLPSDEETKDIWLRYLPPERVLPFGSKDNFWEMGNSGPCGPCTEIHYDRIGGRLVPHLVNMDDPNVLELWNLVFMQYNREPGTRKLSPLPQRHVDTGMGLERITSVLQGVPSNYDIDTFELLFSSVQQVTQCPERYGRRYPEKKKKDEEDEKLNVEGMKEKEKLDEGSDPKEIIRLIGMDTSYRVLCDHVRCLTVMIHDGVLPSNKGRNFMVRRICRRAVYFGKTKLGVKQRGGFLYLLVPHVMRILGKEEEEGTKEKEGYKDEYGWRTKMDVGKQEMIMKTIREEEERFERTWERGRRRFEKEIAPLLSDGVRERTVPGSLCFFMHDTCGFYIDIVEDMAVEKGLKVDKEGFDKELEEQKQRGRADLHTKGTGPHSG